MSLLLVWGHQTRQSMDLKRHLCHKPHGSFSPHQETPHLPPHLQSYLPQESKHTSQVRCLLANRKGCFQERMPRLYFPSLLLRVAIILADYEGENAFTSVLDLLSQEGRSNAATQSIPACPSERQLPSTVG